MNPSGLKSGYFHSPYKSKPNRVQDGNFYTLSNRRPESGRDSGPQGVGAVMEMSADRHAQAEGITFTPDYDIIISDEGKDKRARLTIYSKSGK